jgi:hypothetical protein
MMSINYNVTVTIEPTVTATGMIALPVSSWTFLFV